MVSETYRSREDAANRLVKQMKSELDKLKAEVNRLHLDNKELKAQLAHQSTSIFSADAPGALSPRRPATLDVLSRTTARGVRDHHGSGISNPALDFKTGVRVCSLWLYDVVRSSADIDRGCGWLVQ
jgi:hypothetical protein